MRDLVTTLLDAIGLLLFAAGAAIGAGYVIGPAGIGMAGVVVLAGTWYANHPRKKPRGDS